MVHRTGRLRSLGDPLLFVLDDLVRRWDRQGHPVVFAVVDSGSTPEGAVAAVEVLADREDVGVVVTLAGSHTVPAVARTCARRGVPCVSTMLPWQVYRRQSELGADEGRVFHFAWGLDDIAWAFGEMWRAAGVAEVGCLWNDDVQGRALRSAEGGFVSTAQASGFGLVDLEAYRESESDFVEQVEALVASGMRAVTSAGTPQDLARFWGAARAEEVRLRLLTSSRWLTYPFGAAQAGVDGVATVVSWSPRGATRSSLGVGGAEELARTYEEVTGRPWLQPLGLAHALVEVAVHAVTAAADPRDRGVVAEVLAGACVETVAGRLDWTRGPAPGVARCRWRVGSGGVGVRGGSWCWWPTALGRMCRWRVSCAFWTESSCESSRLGLLGWVFSAGRGLSPVGQGRR
ncbi:ABC transporter substrate-binding protein [Streptoalloteichus tenebrarius]|uniref:ABC transporter substrate-binding protein n=1 Tax=Streptoalloteichus tenebrarius (strain ATCC 17920 / DSM 40477 / JCM 4838 / CBS 697.72 / NBRC 16177 / NCIMB 11028 / NRRL B-12390 / A12253. 1 / ISP 5477) TaxID=1933 RepID=UPI0020A4E0FB|nr:ABC transporter substrate-binding protein [Streptoalloteichus tenebrarius]